MRRAFLILGACLLFAGVPGAHAGELRFTVRADWMFTVRAGLEYRFNRYLGVQGAIGTNVQMLVGNAAVAIYALPAESDWQVKLLLGVPNAGVPLTFNAAMLTVGGSLAASYRLANGVAIEFQIGEGFPFFFEEGTERIRDVGFPFNLWPDIALGASFPLGQR